MKKIVLLPIAVLFGIAFLSGCTSPDYAIHTNDGRTIISATKPAEAKSGLVGYTDANGVNRQIKRSDISGITEVDH